MRLSICIPTYNRLEYLRKTVNSILESKNKEFDLIVCDNFSDDGTEEYCRNKAKIDKRLKYYRNTKNIGISGNIHNCIKYCDTDYAYLLSDEDGLSSSMIDSILCLLKKGYNLILPSVYDTQHNEYYIERKKRVYDKFIFKLIEETHGYLSGIIINKKCLNLETLEKYSKYENNIYQHIPMMLMCCIKGNCFVTDDILCLKGKQQIEGRESLDGFTSNETVTELSNLPYYNSYNRIEQLKFFSEMARTITKSNKNQNIINRYFGKWAVIIYNSDFNLDKYGKPSKDIIKKTSRIEGIGYHFRIELLKYIIIVKVKCIIKKLIFWDKLKVFLK